MQAAFQQQLAQKGLLRPHCHQHHRLPGAHCVGKAAGSYLAARRRVAVPVCQAHRVDVLVNGRTEVLEVDDGQTILEAALDKGLDLPHDCKMGVCMTCPAKMTKGSVDQSAGMLDDEAKDKGYVLLCVATPESDCEVQTIEEEELLAEVMHSGAL